jgi:nicotinamidase-related amidase
VCDPAYDATRTALLVVDPYNDFISEGGKLYQLSRETITSQDCVTHMRQVLAAAAGRAAPSTAVERLGWDRPADAVWAASTSAGDARARERTGSACVQSCIIGERDRAAEPPVDLAAEWEPGGAQWTRDHRQRRLRTGSS